ncbi:P-loop containing nucleoside triphosphate hydrolase protein [Rhizoclosmatium globosum]|uniref:ATP-dependent RNA helicase n=1 Tax=Rhizoclosmatium globosum TaxID=329046 RepID=A0A1Y2CIY0_9FUNG|nr:P-loop containing nucleoside triphosphate hydrolase protein [Rhizoclosmatium globosum]|eukprot:ORY46979.1 P-loop containing nucleoside triphosphate hydrolase protein [Rhizoclosmatium globosum]
MLIVTNRLPRLFRNTSRFSFSTTSTSAPTLHKLESQDQPPTQQPPKPIQTQQQLKGLQWKDYSLISETTRNAITNNLKFDSMTLVQDSVLTVLFGYKQKPLDSAAANNDTQSLPMESLGMSVTVGLPPAEGDEPRSGKLRKQDTTPPPSFRIKQYVDSLETKTKEWTDAGYAETSEEKLTSSEYLRHLRASDLLVRSKTGTGKTLAFVVAALETVLKSPEGIVGSATPILVIAPSRELAAQIKAEASVILKAHGLNCVMLLTYNPCHMIVATPGRLLDILRNDPKLKKRVRGLKVLVYDEADLLLEHGFAATMEAIQNLLPPPSTRQTFMFSATFSPQVKALASGTLRHDKTLSLDTIPKAQVPTHLTTKQTHINCPFSLQPQLLLHLLKSHRASTPFPKIIVFFPTTHLTAHLSHVFNQIPGFDIMELHSQMEQRMRMRVSDRFRASRNGILFTSDVSARGVDYPDVSLVIQMGVPRNLEQYIHRIGRTGRAGKTGSSILVHSSYETPFLVKELQGTGGLPIKRDTVHDPQLIARDAESLAILKEAYRKGEWAMGSACYAAFLGYYRGLGNYMPLTAETLVKAADEFALGLCGLPQVPKIGSGLLTRLGLSVKDGVKVLTPKEEAELRGNPIPNPNAPRVDGGVSKKPVPTKRPYSSSSAKTNDFKRSRK